MTEVSRLYLMHIATVPHNDTPAVCYLIQTQSGQNILVDTGLPPAEELPPDLSPIMQPNVIEQLAELNLQPTDIGTIICTHFDLDHCGYNDHFPRAEYVVQQAHYEHAIDHPRFAGARSHWDQDQARFHFVDGDVEWLPGLHLIETSGHVKGHQSVLLHLPQTGQILLTIDAVPDLARFTTEREPWPMDEDHATTLASTAKLLQLAENVAVTIFGHDSEQWRTIPKSYA